MSFPVGSWARTRYPFNYGGEATKLLAPSGTLLRITGDGGYDSAFREADWLVPGEDRLYSRRVYTGNIEPVAGPTPAEEEEWLLRRIHG